jgi:hypothetical protein
MKSVVALAVLLAACGDNQKALDAGVIDTPIADAPSPDGNPLTPDTLAGTGLCLDPGCMQINPDAREYEPRFALWSDSAAKRRWLYLPPGTKIDTTDMNHWSFPIGTKVWKEFTRDGTRVETRYMAKVKPDTEDGTWFYATYQWNLAQNATMVVTLGVENANGTQHDIPSRSNCRGCHERFKPSRVLGIDAIQLDIAPPRPANLMALDDLITGGKLSTAIPGAVSPHFPLPGTAVDQAALGYLHANCSNCHNPSSDVIDMSPMDLRLRTDMLASVATTPTYVTTFDVNASIPYFENGTQYTKLIIPDDPDNSAVISRMNSMMPLRFMPNLAVKDIDPAGQTALRAWISTL